MVGRNDEPWWRRNGGEATRIHRTRAARSGPAGREVSRARVSADHLGPEYNAPENLERLRQRGLSAKRSLALREFALGMEGLERFVQRQPLRRVHECVFGVLALESEPVDPRL